MTLSDIQLEPGSFQDRDNRVFHYNQRIFRVLGKEAFTHWEILSRCHFFQQLTATEKLVSSQQVSDLALPNLLANRPETAILEHQKIPLISYPYEWSFSMLKDAALLQLDLLLQALGEDMVLKDASPFNIQWLGSHPIFIDVLSFEPLAPGRPWMGYHQFCKLFLYPLLLQAYKKVPFQPWLKGSISGIEQEDFKNMLSLTDYLRPGIFTQVILPTLFQQSMSKPNQAAVSILQAFQSLGNTRLLIQNHVRRLQKLLHQIHWVPSATAFWQNYAVHNNYTEIARQAKADFVTRIVHSKTWDLVWDIGCNTGYFSEIAAHNANLVLALDANHACIESLYKKLKEQGNRRILPLLFNVAEPSPGLGWNGTERQPLLYRGKPELIFCLALLHHVVIHHNIPMNAFIQWLAKLKASLVIEFVSKTDSMVRELLQNRVDQYTDYEQDYFEVCLRQHFDIQETLTLDGNTRTLYFATPCQG